MLHLISLLTLAAASPAFGAHPHAKVISIPLEELTLPTEDSIAKPRALTHQANWDAVRYHSKVQKTRVSKSSVSSFKRHNAPLYNLQNVAWGPLYADTITIGGLSAEDQQFSAADYKGDPLSADASKRTISSRIFSMYLSSGPGSEFYIGGINSKKYTGKITYTPQLEDKWMVVGSASANSEVRYRGKMIIDSGATLIYGSRDSVWHLWKTVDGAEACIERKCGGPGYFTFPCNTAAKFSFMFNGQDFPFTQKDLIVHKVPGEGNLCMGAILAMDSLLVDDTWLLGTRFMKTVYTIFDMDKFRVGFATPVHLKENHRAPGGSGNSSASQETPKSLGVPHPT
ncbi:eukaryotic aspartyl protease, partial [Rhizoctonia solani AG-3 Rhs1AP]